MPCLLVHYAIAKEYLDKHREEDYEEFMRGSFYPDICDNRLESHFSTSSIEDGMKLYLKNKVNLTNFLSKYSLDNSFNRGYYLHLIADRIFYLKYSDIKILDEKESKEISRELIHDYNVITTSLLNKYDFKASDFLPEKYVRIIEVKEYGDLNIIREEDINDLIDKLKNIDLDNYKE